jgi:hypothetical protein
MRFAFPDGRSPCDSVAHLSGSRALRGLARARTGAHAPVPATTALLHTLGNRHCARGRSECTDACGLTTHVRRIGDTVRLGPMDPRAPTAYVFDGFRLDLARRRLTDPDGRVLPLSARAYDVLAYLVENRARVVSKDELMRVATSSLPTFGPIVATSHLGRRPHPKRRRPYQRYRRNDFRADGCWRASRPHCRQVGSPGGGSARRRPIRNRRGSSRKHGSLCDLECQPRTARPLP